MAKPPVEAPAVEEEVVVPVGDTEVPMVEETEAPAEEEEPGHTVLLTVCKEADGTYRLIQGDEDDEYVGGEAEDESVGAEPVEGEVGKVFDSPGALLKAILDVLNEDQSAEGAEGTGDEQFEAGFTGGEPAAAPAGGAPLAPKM